MLEIKPEDNRFVIYDQNKFVGEITYFEDKNHHFVVDHTFVDPSYRGQRLAYRLVETMAAYARTLDKKIIPVCPYVLGLFQDTNDFKDVWLQSDDYDVSCRL